jgi:hypothetical protein
VGRDSQGALMRAQIPLKVKRLYSQGSGRSWTAHDREDHHSSSCPALPASKRLVSKMHLQSNELHGLAFGTPSPM